VISPRERRDAEKTYLRSIFSERNSMKTSGLITSNEEDIEKGLIILHPRYQELKRLYEAEMAPASSTTGGKGSSEANLASEMINIKLNNMIIGSSGPSEPITKRLPSSLSIGKLRLLIKQLFSVDPMNQYLSLRIYKDSIPTELDDDISTLQYYGAIDNAEIFINERNDEVIVKGSGKGGEGFKKSFY
jgi:hypothetical protein